MLDLNLCDMRRTYSCNVTDWPTESAKKGIEVLKTKLFLFLCSNTLEHTSKKYQIFPLSLILWNNTQVPPFSNIALIGVCVCVRVGHEQVV